MTPWTRLFAAAAVALLFSGIAGAQAPDIEKMDIVLRSVPNGPVAIVNGRPVPAEDYIELYKSELARISQRNPGVVIDDGARIGIGLRCLRILVEREILIQEAQRRKINVPDSELEKEWNDEWRRLAQRLGEEDGREYNEQEVLEKAGATREEALAELREALLIERVRAKLVEEKGVKVTDAEVKAYFEENYTKPQSRVDLCHIKQIFLRGVTPTGAPAPEEMAEARKRADTAMQRLRSGQSFGAVAKAMSDGPFRDKEGDIGPAPADQLPPFLLQAALKLKPGEISPIIESEYGYHIIELVSFTEGEEPTLEKVGPMIQQILLMLKTNRVVSEFCRLATEDEENIQTFLNLERQLVLRPDLMELFKAAEDAS